MPAVVAVSDLRRNFGQYLRRRLDLLDVERLELPGDPPLSHLLDDVRGDRP